MTTPIKAVRATITLGDIELEVYQLPCGKYIWGATHITKAIGIRHSRVAEICATKQAQYLASKGVGVADFSSTPVSTDIGKGKGYSTEVAFFVWQYEAFKGNELAVALVFSSGVEALERRADAAFGTLRKEEERNQRFITRRDSILSRNFWTDCIDEYAKTHEVSDNYKRWIYIHVSNYLNKHLFGMTSKEIREHYDIGDNSPRDYFPSETLRIVDAIEKTTALRVQNTDCEPLQTLKDMVNIMGVGRLPL